MRHSVMTSAKPGLIIPVPKKRTVRTETPEIIFPPHRTGGPVHISKILEPIMAINRHPDRNRLLAELFSK